MPLTVSHAAGQVVTSADINAIAVQVNALDSLGFNIKNYGAVADGKGARDGAITTGTAAFTSATVGFAASDVGKAIIINGAGVAAAALVTTILSYQSATAVTLTANASTTVTGKEFTVGTDNTTAIQAAIDAANAAGAGVVNVPAGTYITGKLFLKSGVVLAGVDRAASTLRMRANAIDWPVSVSVGATSFGVRDITLIGRRDLVGAEVLLLDTCSDGRIERVHTDGGEHAGIQTNGICNKLYFNNILITNVGSGSTVGGIGFWMFFGASDCELSNIVIDGVDHHGFVFDPGTTTGGQVDLYRILVTNLEVRNFGKKTVNQSTTSAGIQIAGAFNTHIQGFAVANGDTTNSVCVGIDITQDQNGNIPRGQTLSNGSISDVNDHGILMQGTQRCSLRNIRMHNIGKRGVSHQAVFIYNMDGDVQGPKTITGVAAGANPSITCVAHAFSPGQLITISSVGGAVEVNGKWTVLATPNADHFTITLASHTAYTSGGTVQPTPAGSLDNEFSGINVTNDAGVSWTNYHYAIRFNGTATSPCYRNRFVNSRFGLPDTQLVYPETGEGPVCGPDANYVEPEDTRAAIVFEDDFFSGDLANTTGSNLGQFNWTSAGGVATLIASEANHPGILHRTSSAVASTFGSVYASNSVTLGTILPADFFDVMWVVRLNINDANTVFRAGLMMAPNALPANGIYIEKAAADTSWFGVCRSASSQTRTAALSTVGTGWVRMRVWRHDSATIGFRAELLNGTPIDTGSSLYVTATIPTVTLALGAQVTNNAASADKTFDADYARASLVNLIR